MSNLVAILSRGTGLLGPRFGNFANLTLDPAVTTRTDNETEQLITFCHFIIFAVSLFLFFLDLIVLAYTTSV